MKKVIIAILAILMLFAGPALSATTATDNPPPASTEILQPFLTVEYFPTGENKLSPEAEAELRLVLQKLKDDPNLLILLMGCAGNDQLGQARSREVKQWLQNHGVQSDRVYTVSYAVIASMPANKQGVDVYLLQRQ